MVGVWYLIWYLILEFEISIQSIYYVYCTYCISEQYTAGWLASRTCWLELVQSTASHTGAAGVETRPTTVSTAKRLPLFLVSLFAFESIVSFLKKYLYKLSLLIN